MKNCNDNSFFNFLRTNSKFRIGNIQVLLTPNSKMVITKRKILLIDVEQNFEEELSILTSHQFIS